MKKAQIAHKIREAQGQDLPFIYSTWLKSFRGQSGFSTGIPKTLYFKNFIKVLDYILERETTDVTVITDPNESEVIYGYMVSQPPNTIHYIYIKEAFRKLGLASTLVETLFKDTNNLQYTHRTRYSDEALDKSNDNLIYNPFPLFKGV